MSYLEDRAKRKNGLLPPLPTKKEKKPLNRIAPKTAAKRKLEKENDGDSGLDRWHEERRAEATGKCVLCGGKSEKNNDKTYRCSNHHILEQKSKLKEQDDIIEDLERQVEDLQ